MIDFRSDTVTLPSAAMKQAMLEAPLGDDVYGEDPTVNNLEHMLAAMCEKEAAVFATSGTQSNLLALMSHCERGDEYIVGQDAHTYKYEGGGAAVLGSIQPQPLAFSDGGVIPMESIRAAIKPDDHHFAKTKLVCLENTMGGQILPSDYPSQVRQLCDQHHLNLHLDGARIFNAAVASEESIQALTKPFDSISICLSKGLGAPTGSVLVGGKALIDKARRWRKVLGGGMRQSGMLAAAGIYALENHVTRLAEDHRRALWLAEELQSIAAIEVLPHSAKTNMVFVKIPESAVANLQKKALAQGIKLPDGTSLRLVLHLDIDDAAIERVVEVFRSVFG